MNSLNDYHKKRNELTETIVQLRNHAVEVNNFISEEIKGKHSKKSSFIAGILDMFNPDIYGNKFDKMELTLSGPIMSEVLESNQKLKIQILQEYRSKIHSKIRETEIKLDNHSKEAMIYLKSENN